ncbi:hypothetical protein, partial [Bordetella avium]|uniref:hypothetical protein n=1 Tax=Bordetella avium TaxID=521 RepID=UPI001C711518
DAKYVVDDKPETAWRCNGSGEGQQITLTLPHPSRIVGVGMINGYAKVFGNVDLYPQYRRVRTVRWTLHSRHAIPREGQGDWRCESHGIVRVRPCGWLSA